MWEAPSGGTSGLCLSCLPRAVPELVDGVGRSLVCSIPSHSRGKEAAEAGEARAELRPITGVSSGLHTLPTSLEKFLLGKLE